MKTLRTLGLLVVLCAAQVASHAAEPQTTQAFNRAGHAQQAGTNQPNSAMHVQLAAATIGLAVPAVFSSALKTESAAPSQEAQPDQAVWLLAGLALLGAVISRRCSADSHRA